MAERAQERGLQVCDYSMTASQPTITLLQASVAWSAMVTESYMLIRATELLFYLSLFQLLYSSSSSFDKVLEKIQFIIVTTSRAVHTEMF